MSADVLKVLTKENTIPLLQAWDYKSWLLGIFLAFSFAEKSKKIEHIVSELSIISSVENN